MHIAPYENLNKPVVDVNNELVPLNYFNIVKLKKGEVFDYSVKGYETCIVPATGTVSVDVEGMTFDAAKPLVKKRPLELVFQRLN